ncbi:MAG: hypothetical protein AB3N20_14690 [Rhizobiaceae bacterium]
MTDSFLLVIGLLLAAGSLYFPWHVYHNEDAVILPRLQFSGQGDLYGEAEDRIVPGQAGFVSPVSGQLIDPVITGSVTSEELSETDEAELTEVAGVKIRTDYIVLHTANGLALVRDADSLFIVRKGSTLPDGSRVDSISGNNGVWEVTTSEGYRILSQ